MNFADEFWVKVYTRDTTTWKLLPWQARTLLLHMFRKVDRSRGAIDVGDDGIAGLAAMVDLPLEEVVEPGLEHLLKRGVATFDGVSYVLPRFIEAQTTPSSDKLRAKKHRQSVAQSPSRNVSGASRNVSEPSRDVTERHDASQPVTNRIDQSRSDQSRSETEVAKDKPSPARKQPSGDHADVVACFEAAYLKQNGTGASWGGPQGAMVKRLIASHGAAEVKRRIGILFDSPPTFLAPPFDLKTLVANFDKLAQPSRPNGRNARFDFDGEIAGRDVL